MREGKKQGRGRRMEERQGQEEEGWRRMREEPKVGGEDQMR